VPNWCSTTIAVYGNEEDIQSIASVLDGLRGAKESRVENGFGNLWEGNVLDAYGIPWEGVSCRGVIDDYYIATNKNNEKYLYLLQTDAWCQNVGYLEAIIDKAGYDLKYVYQADEPGCGLYLNSDVERRFLIDKFKIDFVASADIPEMNIENGDDCCEYFDSESSIVEWFSREFTPVKSWKQIRSLFQTHYNCFDYAEIVEYENPD